MITNLGEKIAHKLAVSGTISSDDVDLYSYGFFLLLSSALYLVVVAIFGIAFGILWESICWWYPCQDRTWLYAQHYPGTATFHGGNPGDATS